MAELSRRAARPARNGGLPNALFVLAAAEALPVELASLADLVTVQFPWGSLLRGVLGGDDLRVGAGIAGLLKPSGTLDLLLAPTPRDRLEDVPTAAAEVVAAIARTFGPFGLEATEGREATQAEVRASGSTWAKRLLSGTRPGAPHVGRAHASAGNSSESSDRRVTLVRLRAFAPEAMRGHTPRHFSPARQKTAPKPARAPPRHVSLSPVRRDSRHRVAQS